MKVFRVCLIRPWGRKASPSWSTSTVTKTMPKDGGGILKACLLSLTVIIFFPIFKSLQKLPSSFSYCLLLSPLSSFCLSTCSLSDAAAPGEFYEGSKFNKAMPYVRARKLKIEKLRLLSTVETATICNIEDGTLTIRLLIWSLIFDSYTLLCNKH